MELLGNASHLLDENHICSKYNEMGEVQQLIIEDYSEHL